MFATDIYLDRAPTPTALAEAFAGALGFAADQAVVMDKNDYETLGATWSRPRIRVVLRTSPMRGDFALAIDLRLREETLNLRALLRRTAYALSSSILTDELDVNPLIDSEWLMFSPDGTSTVVHADDEEFAAEDPAIILAPESRRVYESHLAGAHPSTAPH